MITISNSATLNVKINKKHRLLTEENSNIKEKPKNLCISQDVTNKWSTEGCVTKSYKADEVSCTCDKLTFISVVDDVKGVFSNSKNVFTDSNTDALVEFDWFSCILFYLACGISVSYFSLAIWGYFKDRS
jgi:hypothetical protein